MPLQPWKVPEYTALISQTGTNAPTATILYNTLGSIIWTYSNVGVYIGTVSPEFDNTKVYLSATSRGPNNLVTIDNNGNNEIYINTTDATGTPADGKLSLTPIKIQVYNI